jgi:adenosylhomocysteine nucleosidase
MKGATALVSWGAAGGLLPTFSPGTLIIPEAILAADGSVYHVDLTWHERLCSQLKGHVEFDKRSLAESAAVLSRAEKRALYHRTGAMAMDMESASIALVAREAGIPFMAIRAITDDAEMDIPSIAQSSTDEFGRVRLSRLISGILRHPGELLALVRLARNFRVAMATLAAVTRHAGENFAYRDSGQAI